MDLMLPADFFQPANGRTLVRDDLDPSLGADAHVHLDATYISGLRDFRSAPRHEHREQEWQPG